MSGLQLLDHQSPTNQSLIIPKIPNFLINTKMKTPDDENTDVPYLDETLNSYISTDDSNNKTQKVFTSTLNTEIVNTASSAASTLPTQIVNTTGSIAYYAISSSIGRKAIFTGALYLAGGTIISTIGLAPVIVTGAVIWLL